MDAGWLDPSAWAESVFVIAAVPTLVVVLFPVVFMVGAWRARRNEAVATARVLELAAEKTRRRVS